MAQFFGAFNDNAWKMFVIVLAGRTIAGLDPAARESAAHTQTMLAFVIFTVPLVLFSLPAGTLADRLSKRTVLLGGKTLEMVLMGAGTLALIWAPDSQWPLFTVLGLMGLQSALFGPAKYGILPELVGKERLSAANGFLSMWTFLAIIAGTALGPRLLPDTGPQLWLGGAVLVVLSAVGLAAARGIPRVPPARSDGTVRDTVTAAWSAVRGDRALGLAVLGSAWFWAISSLLGQDLIVYAKTVLQLDEDATGIPLGVFGIGVGLGSVAAGRLSEGKIETGLIPLGAIGLGLITLLLGVLAPGLTVTLILLVLLGVSSGLLIVPLDALIQWRSPPDRRGAVIAFSNVIVFGGMLAGSLIGGAMAAAELSSRGILVGASVLTLLGTAWAIKLLPDALLRFVIFLFTHLVYRVKVIGAEHVPQKGGVLLAPNHVSLADGLFLSATLDRPIRFVVDRGQYERPLLKPFFRLLGAIPIDSLGGTRSLLHALRDAGEYLDQGEVVCIFPEGQITRTGALQPFKRGIERIAKGRDAPIIPVHLDRVWGSIFSFERGRFVKKLPEELPYPITVSFGEPLPPDTSLADMRSAVVELGERAWWQRKANRRPLHAEFVKSVRRRPWRLCMADATRPRVSRIGALAGGIVLARALRETWGSARRVGILLPPSVAGGLVNLAAALSGRTAVNLNYTAGTGGMGSAARQAGIERVVTSRTFLERAELELPDGLEPCLLEDLAGHVRPAGKLLGLVLAALAPVRLIEKVCGATRSPTLDDDATIIFSSGSTGEPKGVRLTHFNVDSNVEAASQVFRVSGHDRMLGILPHFHSFGYMSLWFCLHRGMGIVFHPNPLDGPAIGKLVFRYGVTILLATPTFLQMYMRRCTPEEFGSLRIVLVGAEKLSDRLATTFEDTFGIRPLEGYGTTECSPVIAASVPPFRARGFYQAGSKRGFVGLPVPGMAAKIVDPDTGDQLPSGEAGMLLVKGPNVMAGYLDRDDLTADVMRDGWYVTGDIALLDEDGFLKITDRLSRFSKIGGEMVPHGKVEEALHEAYGEANPQRFAVTAIPDERKGERLAVLATIDSGEVPALLERTAEAGLPNLFMPRQDAFVFVDEIPLLGSGKVDLKALKAIAAERLTSGPGGPSD